jgi:hypothetical protein
VVGRESKGPLASVPVAGEDHRVALDDMKASLLVEPSGYLEALPVQRARLARERGRQQKEEKAYESRRAHV